MAEAQPHVSEHVRKALYSNGFSLHVTQDEVDLQFLWGSPFDNLVQSRIVVSPRLAKALLGQLQTALKRYEQQNGEIKMPPQPPKKEKKAAESSMFG